MKIYERRFRSLRRAYELIGYLPPRDYSYVAINRSLRVLHHEHLAHIVSELTSVGARVDRDETTNLLTVNGEFTVALRIARCPRDPRAGISLGHTISHLTRARYYRWLENGTRQHQHPRLLHFPEH